MNIFGFFKIQLYWSYIGPTFPRVNISIIHNFKVVEEGRIILLGRRLLQNSIRNLRDVFSWVTIVSGHFVTHSKTRVRSDNHWPFSVNLITVFTLEQQATSRSWSRIQCSKGGACAYYEGYACRKLKVSNTGIVSWVCTNQQTQSHYVVIQSKDKLPTSGTKREHSCSCSDKHG